MPDSTAIVWFRQDLRLHDNPALAAATEFDRVIPIYILDDDTAGSAAMGAASRAWLHHSLDALDQSLDGALQYFDGPAERILPDLIASLGVDAIFWNRCYEPWRIQRDQRIKTSLLEAGKTVQSFNASLLWEPWTVHKADGTPYRVFTPYFQKGCLRAPAPRSPMPAPQHLETRLHKTNRDLSLEALDLLPRDLDWHESMMAHWSVGEAAASQQLEHFCDNGLSQYREGRDFPGIEATSRLSPHLHFGEISPHQVWSRIEQETLHQTSANASHYLRELGWREFSYYLLYHFPTLAEVNFNPRFNGFKWAEDDKDKVRWQRGLTGFPIVDAGMRELWQTGYMHNRVRMIVASFLIKNMLIHWREGAGWFWDCLVDADLASNSASWQWCAGSGADAAPYFRIFNPVLQSQKFDAAGDYIATYCPELAALPSKYRHEPWLADDAVLNDADIQLGIDYPKPILDLKVTRERALAAYKALA